MQTPSSDQNSDRRQSIRDAFARHGVSIAAWARKNNFSVPLVYAVLEGRRKGLRGECAQIAMALGLRDGVPGGLEKMPY